MLAVQMVIAKSIVDRFRSEESWQKVIITLEKNPPLFAFEVREWTDAASGAKPARTKQCEGPECTITFPVGLGKGRTDKKFCSDHCRNRALRVRNAGVEP
jgi:hypothetical protein